MVFILGLIVGSMNLRERMSGLYKGRQDGMIMTIIIREESIMRIMKWKLIQVKNQI